DRGRFGKSEPDVVVGGDGRLPTVRSSRTTSPALPPYLPRERGKVGRRRRRELFMAKKITGYLKLQVPVGSANPSPPIGPALGQRGLNIMEFCKSFNAQTQKLEKGSPIPVVITVYADRSFTFEMKTPPVSFFLKKAANIQAGAKAPGRD